MARKHNSYAPQLLSWVDIARGAAAGGGLLLLSGIVLGYLEGEVLESNEFRFGVFLLQLVAFSIAGAIAGYGMFDRPVLSGILAAVGAVLGWLPIRAVIWWLNQRDSGYALISEQGISLSAYVSAFGLSVVVGATASIIGAGIHSWKSGY